MIPRDRHTQRIRQLLDHHPAVAILGARQVGKTTLAREILSHAETPGTLLDLEDPDDVARLEEPMLALRDLKGLVVIDEVQRRPDLFAVLRVLIDRPAAPARFLILGSASRDLIRQSSETLAGRIIYHELDGFAIDEIGASRAETLWVRGGFPRSFLAPSEAASSDWRRAFIQTFLERDIPQLGIRVPGPTLHRFWRMLAHYHGQVWNGAELSRAFGVAATTVRRYLDLLSGTLVVRQLAPWHENVGKRQVKSPKVYIADTGLLHTLLGIGSRDDLDGHPKVGASWEGFVLREVITRLGAREDECFFWATYGGAELDLLVVRGRQRLGFEIKRTTAPATTRSIHAARETLALQKVFVVHAGEASFPLSEGCQALAFARLYEDLQRLPD
jgi:predicted AAA+ superfamily ATPase